MKHLKWIRPIIDLLVSTIPKIRARRKNRKQEYSGPSAAEMRAKADQALAGAKEGDNGP